MVDLIPVHCFTNLDDFRQEKWPDTMTCRPLVGDSVSADSGKRLKIVRITHMPGRHRSGISSHGPYLKLELHRS